MKKLTLSVAKPCNNDWDKMTTNEQGRHCSSCNKTVIDFSTYTDKELYEFFKNMPEGICGHIPSYKLDTLLMDSTKNRNPFFKKLFWGTAIASWLGLVNKAEAKDAPKPSTEQITRTSMRRALEEESKDTTKKAITFSFYDAASKQLIPYVSIGVSIDGNTVQSAETSNGVCTISLPESAIGKSVVLSCSSSEYADKSILIKVSSLPMSKKIYLNFQKRHIMVNGGLAARPMDR